MPIIAIFTKEEQTELKKMKKQEKDGKVIDWDTYLTKRSQVAEERWKNYQRKPAKKTEEPIVEKKETNKKIKKKTKGRKKNG